MRYGLEHIALFVYRLTYYAGQSALRNIVDYVGTELFNASTCYKRTICIDADYGIGLLTAHNLKGIQMDKRKTKYKQNIQTL